MKNKTLNLSPHHLYSFFIKRNWQINGLAFCLLMALIGCTSNKANTNQDVLFAPLKERNNELSKLPDWERVKEKASQLFAKIDKDTNDLQSKILLAQLYMQEARITGEHPYYYPATLLILEDVIKRDHENFEAYAYKASVQLSLHHFKEALNTGTKAAKLNSYNGFIYGVLCDANVELGNYKEAVNMSDKMQSLRPGLESYSRASYLREIYGDNVGAIEVMNMALQSGLPGSEEAAWAGNTLANLYRNTGNLKNAEEVSLMILQHRPGYAFAVSTLGTIEMDRGHYDMAIRKFDEAIALIPEVSFYENKAEALNRKGETLKAKGIYKTCIAMLNQDAESGHYVDMELAKIYLVLGDTKNALKYAIIEYQRRPNNMDANHCLARAYYSIGKFAEAQKYMNIALRMGTKNAELLNHAGAIEMALKNKKLADHYLNLSETINPHLTLPLPNRT